MASPTSGTRLPSSPNHSNTLRSLWKPDEDICKFVEVKGPGDSLSETQKVWIDVLLSAGVEVEVCRVVTLEEREEMREKERERKEKTGKRGKKRARTEEEEEE